MIDGQGTFLDPCCAKNRKAGDELGVIETEYESVKGSHRRLVIEFVHYDYISYLDDKKTIRKTYAIRHVCLKAAS